VNRLCVAVAGIVSENSRRRISIQLHHIENTWRSTLNEHHPLWVGLSPCVRKADAFLREKGADSELENVNIMPMPDWFKESA